MPTDSSATTCERDDDPHAAYRAARKSAAWFDLPERTHIEVGGRDRGKFLHNFCTNDIRGLGDGRACEAFITSVQGKILAYVSVYASADALWLTTVPDCADGIIRHLSRYQISEDVTFFDRSGDFETLLVAGPDAPRLVGTLLPAAAGLEDLMVAPAEIDGEPLQVRRHDFLRLPGVVFMGPPAAIARVRELLTRAGVCRAGFDVFNALRIEAGFPLYGVDITENNLAQEAARTAQAISFTKGCYLGQEPIARIDALGHVNQQLRGLRLGGGQPPRPGSEIFTQGIDPRKAGIVTSAAISYGDDRPVALAYLRRGHETPGGTLDVMVEGNNVPATVFWFAD